MDKAMGTVPGSCGLDLLRDGAGFVDQPQKHGEQRQDDDEEKHGEEPHLFLMPGRVSHFF
jgi:hypothetical protein